ncbi:MAG: hypothetical protein V2A76_12720 [Planctomycetota bacterium]
MSLGTRFVLPCHRRPARSRGVRAQQEVPPGGDDFVHGHHVLRDAPPVQLEVTDHLPDPQGATFRELDLEDHAVHRSRTPVAAQVREGRLVDQ